MAPASLPDEDPGRHLHANLRADCLRGAPRGDPRTWRRQETGHQPDPARVQPGQRPHRLRQHLSWLGDSTAQRAAGQEADDGAHPKPAAGTRSGYQTGRAHRTPERRRKADGGNLQSRGDGRQAADHGRADDRADAVRDRHPLSFDAPAAAARRHDYLHFAQTQGSQSDLQPRDGSARWRGDLRGTDRQTLDLPDGGAHGRA
jgi:hypothetical protein